MRDSRGTVGGTVGVLLGVCWWTSATRGDQVAKALRNPIVTEHAVFTRDRCIRLLDIIRLLHPFVIGNMSIRKEQLDWDPEGA